MSLFQKGNNVAIKLIRDPEKKNRATFFKKKRNIQEKKSANQKKKNNWFVEDYV